MTESPPKSTKVLVIGGGPAGSTVATFLRQASFEVVLFEREKFPRYHIGESQLPSSEHIIDLLGAREDFDKQGFYKKEGGVWDWNGEFWVADFKQIHKGCAHVTTHHLLRSELDQVLLENSKKQGARVFEGYKVDELTLNSDGKPVSAKWTCIKDGTSDTITMDYLVDCSGRNGIMATKYLRSRNMNNTFKNHALWSYWTNVQPVEDFYGLDTIKGPIYLGSRSECWLWGIPFKDGRTGVGTVMRDSYFRQLREQGMTSEEIYMQEIKRTSFGDFLKDSKRGEEFYSAADYSYTSSVLYGNGFYICGDAACFIDPLLSSGVHLAMFSGMICGASLISVLKGEVTPEDGGRYYQKVYMRYYLKWLLMVASLYRQIMPDHKPTTLREQSENLLEAPFVQLISGLDDVTELSNPKGSNLTKKLEKAFTGGSTDALGIDITDFAKVPKEVFDTSTDIPMKVVRDDGGFIHLVPNDTPVPSVYDVLQQTFSGVVMQTHHYKTRSHNPAPN